MERITRCIDRAIPKKQAQEITALFDRSVAQCREEPTAPLAETIAFKQDIARFCKTASRGAVKICHNTHRSNLSCPLQLRFTNTDQVTMPPTTTIIGMGVAIPQIAVTLRQTATRKAHILLRYPTIGDQSPLFKAAKGTIARHTIVAGQLCHLDRRKPQRIIRAMLFEIGPCEHLIRRQCRFVDRIGQATGKEVIDMTGHAEKSQTLGGKVLSHPPPPIAPPCVYQFNPHHLHFKSEKRRTPSR